MLTHGCTFCRLHANVPLVPVSVALASGRDASYFMISTTGVVFGIVTHSWPIRSPLAAPSSVIPSQSLSRASHDSGDIAPGPVVTHTAGPWMVAALHWNAPK